MAVVMNSEENMLFAPAPLHRSHSQPQFISSSFGKSQQKLDYNPPHFYGLGPATDSPETAPTSTFASLRPNPSYTPSFGAFGAGPADEDEDGIVFPSYDDYGSAEDLEPPASPRTGHSYTVSPTNSSPQNQSRSESPAPVEHADDDTAVRVLPTRHVDYLSHNWSEEDIWASWKHIVSQRDAYSNSARLENACWRTWLKAKYDLKTVSPEKLNWLKDCDVTWLYGPLQTGTGSVCVSTNANASAQCSISKSNSFLHKKPILKKRSMSEVMLQRSISSSSLLKQATAAVQAQQARRIPRSTDSVCDPFAFAIRRESGESSSVVPSIMSSDIPTPATLERHIHFNDQVQQCIALDIKGDEELDALDALDYESDSTDSGIVMKNAEKKLPALKRRARGTPESRTIAMLPSTTLKCLPDDEAASRPELTPPAISTPRPEFQPPTDTIRSTLPANGILLGADDDEDDDEDMDWPATNRFLGRRDSVSVTHDRMAGFHAADTKAPSTMGLGYHGASEPSGMRRTPSGMFMPYDEDEDDMVSEGLFGKVVDTVNTAKDIAHVIWNVGWRR